MLLRRLAEHVRSQNWFAVALDLLVVVVGIFLAFQVERLYSDQRARADAQERIYALVEDFAHNREELDFQIMRHRAAIEAAANLLELDERNPAIEDYDRFYGWLADTARALTSRFRRGAYDVLISTGEIDLIADKLLQSELAEFYALLDELAVSNQASLITHRRIFEPYVAENLDHVMMLQFMHPSDGRLGIQQNQPTQEKGYFLQVIGTVAFEGVIAAKWHAERDELRQLEELQPSLLSIEDRLQRFADVKHDQGR